MSDYLPDIEDTSLLLRIKRYRFVTRTVLWIEILSLWLWRPAFWTAAFLGICSLGLPFFLSPFLNLAFFLFFIGGLIYLALDGSRGLQRPSLPAIDRRLEHASALPHRPLSALHDTLANPQALHARGLWQNFLENSGHALRTLKFPHPRALIARRDLYALRGLAILLFLSGLLVSGPDWRDRIWNALAAPHILLPGDSAPHILLTFTPPDYTGFESVTLSGPAFYSDLLEIPVNSTLKVSASSSLGYFSLTFNDISRPLEGIDAGYYGGDYTLQGGDSIQLSQLYLPRFYTPLHIIPDHPPEISITDRAQQDDNQETAPTHHVTIESHVRFPLSVFDDYGVKDLQMRMTLSPLIEDAPLGYPVEDVRSVMSAPKDRFSFDPVYDFTASPWAGLPAQVHFQVSDHTGQIATLPPIEIILPEREFRHPVSKSLIGLRKTLAWGGAKYSSGDMIATLENLLAAPQNFQDDLVVFLALRSAASRIYHADGALSDDDTWELVSLLWDIALRVEDGNLSLAARNLREAQRDLEEALRRGEATDSEILSLTEQIQSYLQEYMAELGKELQKRMADGDDLSSIPPEFLQNSMNSDSMEDFMQQMQNELMQGNIDKAREMLSELQRMLDHFNPSMLQPLPQDMQMMLEARHELQELIDRQDDLRNQTQMQAESLKQQLFQQENFGDLFKFTLKNLDELKKNSLPIPPVLQDLQDSTNTPFSTADHKVEQDALRFVLGQLMLDAGEFFETIPENLGLAELEMRDSSTQLENNRPDLSVPHQDEAIAQLKQAQDDMQQQIQQRVQQMASSGAKFWSLPRMGGLQTDPLGNPMDRDDKLPLLPQKTPEDILETLKLLREKSGELHRSKEELDYFKRLLKQF